MGELVEHAASSRQPFRKWSQELRDIWQAENEPRRRRELVFLHIVGCLVCLTCIPLDYSYGYDVFEQGLVVRLGVVVPIYLLAIVAAQYGGWQLQRWTTIITVPAFASVAGYMGMHVGSADQLREYVMATGLLITMASVILPLRPRQILIMVLLSLAGLWAVWATMPVIRTGHEHILLAFMSAICLINLAIPIRTARLKDQNFLYALRGRLVSERLVAANEQLRELSHRDDLTSLPNRRYFERIFDTAFRASTESGEHLAVLMIDVDHFKQFNDTYGHLAGDKALQQVADALQKHFAVPGCTIARYGGEEFIAIVEQRDEEVVLWLADGLRKAIANRDLALDEETRVRVTASIGVAMRRAATTQPSDLVAQADGALYDAKQAGRDLVRMAREDSDGPPPPELVAKSA